MSRRTSDEHLVKYFPMRGTEASEHRYRMFFHSVRDGLFVHGIDETGLPGTFIDVNDTACLMLGYSRDELLKLSPRHIMERDSVLDVPDLMAQLVEAKEIHFETVLLTSDGASFPVEIRSRLFHFQGSPTILSSVRDITDRKIAEEELRLSNERFRQLAEASSEAVAIHEKGKILDVNDRFCQMFGYAREEAIRMNALDFAAPESRETVLKNILDDSTRPYEAIGIRKNGSSFVVEIRGRTIAAGKRMTRVTAIREITEQKRAESIQQAVYKISEAVHTASSLEEMFRIIHGIIGGLMPANNFYIALIDASGSSIRFPYYVDEFDEPPPPQPVGRGLTEYVLRTGKPLLAPPEVERELVRKGEIELVGAPQVDWLGVPLKIRDRIIGVLTVQSYREGVRFGEEEKNILQFVSMQVAMAIERKQSEEALQSSEERYRTFVRQISEGIWRTEMDHPIPVELPEDDQLRLIYENGRIAECNDVMARMYGYSTADEMRGIRMRDLHLEELHNFESGRKFIRSGYRSIDAESHEIDRFGNRKYFLNNSIGIVQGGFLIGTWGTQRDITEQKLAAEALRDSEERYRLLFERNLAGVYRTTKDGAILDCNESFARILGYSSREELLGQKAWNFYPDAPSREAFLFRLHKHQALTNFEVRLRRKDGSTVWGLENVSLLPGNDGTAVVEGTLIDITDRKKAEEQIAYQAYHDELTGLPNRNLFRDRLNQELARVQRHVPGLAVLFLDLDHFKLINDTLGHSVGDWLIKQVAERLKRAVRDLDTVARLGGDEFILLLPETSRSEDAARVAQKVLEAISLPLRFDSHDLYITTSIGISMSPADGVDSETLVKCADNAMYRAKELGRNNYQLWSPALNVRVHERLSMERSIRRAIERNEFILYYQPQVRLKDGAVTGIEALIRWRHPEKGLIYPKDFIPIAEESRLILPIGEWLLRTACRQAKQWQEDGFRDLRVSLNLSARQFQHQDLIGLLERVLEETGLDPSCLILEITETVAMQNVEFTLALLHTLKRKGIQIALDDFGMGYSSLSYLKHFPIDIIKIDPSFVRDLGTGIQEEALVRAIIHLGHSMKRTIIAEGVETETQHTFLRFEGCEEVQGFLISHPLPPEEVKKFLQSRVTNPE